MTQHTVGPWRVGYDGPSLPIVDSREGFIAFVKQPNDGAAEANANLIAAAPELLEALKSLLFFYTTEDDDEYGVIEAKAAIARAEGS